VKTYLAVVAILFFIIIGKISRYVIRLSTVLGLRGLMPYWIITKTNGLPLQIWTILKTWV
ncbi:hypothetical protein Q766_15355, partial [Flavobacterium subsaxonicum WB 4.1-42 = DSM 21790]